MTNMRQAQTVVYEPAGDTLRIHSAEPLQTPLAMRDVRLALDAAGHLVAIMFDGDDALPVIALGPPAAAASVVLARVMAMENGDVLITMAMKRIRGHERNPYVSWSLYAASPR